MPFDVLGGRALAGVLLAAAVGAGCGGEPAKLPRAPVGAHRSAQAEEARRAFWRWFSENEAHLFREASTATIESAVDGKLDPIEPGLTCTVGPIRGDRRELVLGAGGNRTLLALVHDLVAEAPPLPRWELVELAPRRSPMTPVLVDGVEVAPDQVEFAIYPQGRKIGIALFFDAPIVAEPVTMRRIGYALLDQALGERDVTTKLGRIDWRPKDSRAGAHRDTLPRLAETFDRTVAGLATEE